MCTVWEVNTTCIRQNVCTSLRRPRRLVPDRQSHLHTSKRMHFIEDGISRVGGCRSPCLHTSKRMHFIEDDLPYGRAIESTCLHTSKRMHFIEERAKSRNCLTACSCIRQNVCTSLRRRLHHPVAPDHRTCIRQNVCTSLRTSLSKAISSSVKTCIRQNVCTSLRTHAPIRTV